MLRLGRCAKADYFQCTIWYCHGKLPLRAEPSASSMDVDASGLEPNVSHPGPSTALLTDDAPSTIHFPKTSQASKETRRMGLGKEIRAS